MTTWEYIALLEAQVIALSGYASDLEGEVTALNNFNASLDYTGYSVAQRNFIVDPTHRSRQGFATFDRALEAERYRHKQAFETLPFDFQVSGTEVTNP